MRLLLISYDLRIPGRNYEGVIAELKSALSWWHYLDSTWIIRTSLTMDEWNDRLRTKMDKNDSLLIIDVTNCARQGWLVQDAWNWICEQNRIITETESNTSR